MINYSKEPVRVVSKIGMQVPSFIVEDQEENIDWETVDSFGDEWTRFNSFDQSEIDIPGDQYFDIAFPYLNKMTTVLDVGCGTGRWTKYVCDRAGFVAAIDPSDAIFQAA